MRNLSTRLSSFALLAIFSLGALTACPSGGAENQLQADTGPVDETDAQADADAQDPGIPAVTLRVATYNASLYRMSEGELAADLADDQNEQAQQIAEVIQRVRPDVILINEFDWDADGTSAGLFDQNYLSVGQNGADPIEYPYYLVPATNTGIHSGVDLNNDGDVVSTPGSDDYAQDAFGYGQFPGQYGMVIYSKYPIVEDDVRTFQTLLWKDMPDNLMPTDYYSAEAIEIFRLSSKNHVDAPVEVDGHRLHILASHPTPPAFDGEEQRNVRRNNDEIRLFVDYLTAGDDAAYIQDDSGTEGGLPEDAAFVIVGDLNNDPNDGDGFDDAIHALLDHPRVQDTEPSSVGAVEDSTQGANRNHNGDPALNTANFNDHTVGNLRVDYALPSSNTTVEDSGVFWPGADEEHRDLRTASDHHMVWVEITLGQ